MIEIPREDAKELMRDNRVFSRNLLSKASANMTRNAIDGGRSHRAHRIAFAHIRTSTQPISKAIQCRLQELGESLGRIVNESEMDAESRLSDCPTLVLEEGTKDTESIIRKQLADWSELDRIVFDIDFHQLELNQDYLQGLLSFAEKVFLVVEPESAASIVPQLQEVLRDQSEWSKKLNVIR